MIGMMKLIVCNTYCKNLMAIYCKVYMQTLTTHSEGQNRRQKASPGIILIFNIQFQ